MKRIYFIKPVGLPGPIKIGASINPGLRIDSLSLWSPLKLELIGTTPGDHDDERLLHHHFFHSHSHGEWFFPTPDLIRAIPLILERGISYARENFEPVGSHRSRMVSDEIRQKISRGVQANWNERKANNTGASS